MTVQLHQLGIPDPGWSDQPQEEQSETSEKPYWENRYKRARRKTWGIPHESRLFLDNSIVYLIATVVCSL